jgi:predicted ATPase/DNA-binding XRE family transcriptional regulator
VQATPSEFGELLRRFRVAAELSQEELAQRAGLSVRGISDLERGARRAPHPHTVAALAEALGLAAEERRRLLAAGTRRRALARPQRPDPSRTNLPVPATSFVGREDEQATVRRLLEQSRLVTLSGTGGVGKTRLAIETAAGLVGDYPGGVWLVELAALPSVGIKGSPQTSSSVGIKGSPQTSNDAALLAQEVARTLGIREAPNTTILDSLVEALAEQPRLLLLDNCEHLGAGVAEFVETLLRRCPAVRMLATSRAALGVIGETVWWVPSLPIPEATVVGGLPRHTAGSVRRAAAGELFCARAAATHPAFALTDDNAAAVAAICRRLDGLPLAIELAAARARILTPAQIAAHLDQRFRLLTGGAPEAPTRQQTLRAALDWSHDLLAAPERVLLRRLSVFVGGCTIEAVDDVCVDEDVLRDALFDLLAGLVEKSLVVVDFRGESARYRMLETIGAYAAERLASAGEAAAMHSRLTGWAVALAERAESELNGPTQAAWQERLEHEHDNLRATLQWTLDSGQVTSGLRLGGALWPFWYRRGYLAEGRGWCDRLLARDSRSPGSVRAPAWLGAGFLARYQGDFPAAAAYAVQALTLCREIEHKQGICDALFLLGSIAVERSEWVAAEVHLTEHLAIARALDDHTRIASSLSALGVVARWQERLDEARAYYEEALAINRALGDLSNIAISLNNVARMAQVSGDLTRARQGYEEAIAMARQMGNKHQTGIFLGSLAEVVRRQGDLAAAQQHGREALTLTQEIGDRPAMANAYSILTSIELDLGDPAAAWSYAVANLELARDLGDPRRTVPALLEAAACAQAAGRPATATRLFGAVAAIGEATAHALSDAGARRLAEQLGMLRATLGEDAFTAAYAEGRALTPNAAIASALGAPHPPTSVEVRGNP